MGMGDAGAVTIQKIQVRHLVAELVKMVEADTPQCSSKHTYPSWNQRYKQPTPEWQRNVEESV
jgi:hypothetical protein